MFSYRATVNIYVVVILVYSFLLGCFTMNFNNSCLLRALPEYCKWQYKKPLQIQRNIRENLKLRTSQIFIMNINIPVKPKIFVSSIQTIFNL